MEDQQPVTGDLTENGDQDERAESTVATEAATGGQPEPEGPQDEVPSTTRSRRRSGWRRTRPRAAAVRSEPALEDETAATATEVVEDADPDKTQVAEDGDQTAAEIAEPSEKTPRARKPAGRRLVAAVLVAAALFVGSAAFAGAMVQPYLADRAVVATKLNIARTAANAITTLWTYTPDNLDKLADRASLYLTGDFEAQYRRFVDALVAPNKQAQVSNNTLVTGAAVESLEGSNAVAIVYTNSTSTSPMTKNIPALKYLSYRLFMKRDRQRWLVTRMNTITSLDLTPRL